MDAKKIFDISDKIAIITGAASGIGKGIAQAFAALGCAVALFDIDQDALKNLEAEIRRSGGKALGVACNVADSKSVQDALAQAVREFGGVDILINNAGIGRRAKAEVMSDQDWDAVLDINLKGSFFFCREAGKQMIAQGRGGRIINIASVSAIVGVETGNANYSASKGGMVAMARCLAVEWAKYNILINTIVPSHTRTPLIENLIKQNADVESYFRNNILLGRLGEVDDLVGPAVFLASEASCFMTGQTLVVDGGHSAK